MGRRPGPRARVRPFLSVHPERLLGRGRDELLGRVPWDEFAAALGTAFEEHHRHAVETGEPVAFEQYYQPLETRFEVRAWPSDEGLSVFFHDVTARVRAERARARATERLRLRLRGGHPSVGHPRGGGDPRGPRRRLPPRPRDVAGDRAAPGRGR